MSSTTRWWHWVWPLHRASGRRPAAGRQHRRRRLRVGAVGRRRSGTRRPSGGAAGRGRGGARGGLGLAAGGAADVAVINRTPSRAQTAADTANAAGQMGQAGRVGSIDDIAAADIVVNATPVGMGEHSPNMPATPPCCDQASGRGSGVRAAGNRLAGALRHRGVEAHNGLSMLAYQAAAAFELWTGIEAPVDEMRRPRWRAGEGRWVTCSGSLPSQTAEGTAAVPGRVSVVVVLLRRWRPDRRVVLMVAHRIRLLAGEHGRVGGGRWWPAAGRLGSVGRGSLRSASCRSSARPVDGVDDGGGVVAVVVRFDVGWTIPPAAVAAASLVTLSAVDLRAYRLPDAISFPASGLSPGRHRSGVSCHRQARRHRVGPRHRARHRCRAVGGPLGFGPAPRSR